MSKYFSFIKKLLISFFIHSYLIYLCWLFHNLPHMPALQKPRSPTAPVTWHFATSHSLVPHYLTYSPVPIPACFPLPPVRLSIADIAFPHFCLATLSIYQPVFVLCFFGLPLMIFVTLLVFYDFLLCQAEKCNVPPLQELAEIKIQYHTDVCMLVCSSMEPGDD